MGRRRMTPLTIALVFFLVGAGAATAACVLICGGWRTEASRQSGFDAGFAQGEASAFNAAKCRASCACPEIIHAPGCPDGDTPLLETLEWTGEHEHDGEGPCLRCGTWSRHRHVADGTVVWLLPNRSETDRKLDALIRESMQRSTVHGRTFADPDASVTFPCDGMGAEVAP